MNITLQNDELVLAVQQYLANRFNNPDVVVNELTITRSRKPAGSIAEVDISFIQTPPIVYSTCDKQLSPETAEPALEEVVDIKQEIPEIPVEGEGVFNENSEDKGSLFG